MNCMVVNDQESPTKYLPPIFVLTYIHNKYDMIDIKNYTAGMVSMIMHMIGNLIQL